MSKNKEQIKRDVLEKVQRMGVRLKADPERMKQVEEICDKAMDLFLTPGILPTEGGEELSDPWLHILLLNYIVGLLSPETKFNFSVEFDDVANINSKLKEIAREYLEKQKNKEPYKISAHLIEQTLKPGRIQRTLFDPIRREEIESIENKSFIDGIDLTASEHKIIYSICKLLHNKSQTKDPTREDYYTGDAGAILVPSKSIEAPGEKVQAPQIYCTLYELTKEYSGGGNPGGKQIENVESILAELKEKKFTFTYKQTIKKKGKNVERAITGQRALLHIDLATEKVDQEETLREKIITLEPIFRNQIESKFLLYPQDHIKRIEEAWGSKKAPSIVFSMVDYLNQIRSGKQGKGRSAGEIKSSIYVSNLYKKIDPKTLNQGKKSRLKSNIEKALAVCKEIGLLVDYDLGTGKTGEKMYTFYINKKWE